MKFKLFRTCPHFKVTHQKDEISDFSFYLINSISTNEVEVDKAFSEIERIINHKNSFVGQEIVDSLFQNIQNVISHEEYKASAKLFEPKLGTNSRKRWQAINDSWESAAKYFQNKTQSGSFRFESNQNYEDPDMKRKYMTMTRVLENRALISETDLMIFYRINGCR